MFGGRYKGCLCELCEGCDKLDNDTFRGLFSCDDYVRSPLAKDELQKAYSSESYTQYIFPKKVTPKKENKTYTIEINDLEEGKKLLSDLESKQYFFNIFEGDDEGDGEFIAIFYCYDNSSKDYCSRYEVKTVSRLFKDELMNLYRGV